MIYYCQILYSLHVFSISTTRCCQSSLVSSLEFCSLQCNTSAPVSKSQADVPDTGLAQSLHTYRHNRVVVIVERCAKCNTEKCSQGGEQNDCKHTIMTVWQFTRVCNGSFFWKVQRGRNKCWVLAHLVCMMSWHHCDPFSSPGSYWPIKTLDFIDGLSYYILNLLPNHSISSSLFYIPLTLLCSLPVAGGILKG